VGQGEPAKPQVRLAAKRLALGQSFAPPPEIIFHILGEKFGMWPEQVASLPIEEVLLAWMIHAELQPKGK
jgi:hypothetical protein